MTFSNESLCEDALEMLQDILYYNGYLCIWFDRNISFEAGSALSADIVSLPRLITPRSNEKLRDDNRITNKRSVKISVVERAIDAVGRD